MQGRDDEEVVDIRRQDLSVVDPRLATPHRGPAREDGVDDRRAGRCRAGQDVVADRGELVRRRLMAQPAGQRGRKLALVRVENVAAAMLRDDSRGDLAGLGHSMLLRAHGHSDVGAATSGAIARG